MGWKSVYSDEEYQGRMYINGLKESNGDIITFLDDDDTYMPNRLEYVYNIFTYNPDIGYLQHSRRQVDIDGNISPVFEAEASRNLVPQSELKLTWDMISKYKEHGYSDPILYIFRNYRLHPDVNSTSIAVKRELLERHANLLGELPYGPDCFFFASAITDKVPMFFSDANLSTRMYHGNNFVSRLQLHDYSPEEIEHLIKFYFYYYLSYNIISRRLLNYYPNFYACEAEKYRIIYLNLVKQHKEPSIVVIPDQGIITWCDNNNIHFN
jgi:Glycosyl transferase family 2.